ncbi:MAG: NnrS family protein [Micavibrio aeruginosavorus]|uniref:NnrS family protein n=1 Tax=Micavibrio aeruginosavorus TaxID=349221 RepID=A0A7T5R4B8_9BACT|nr:MAG: NnrS family protein [Micavibrio aeruginosavorus]
MPVEPDPSIFDHPFWGRGFRPFFMGGGLYAASSILIWVGFYAGYITPPDVLPDVISWHAHEMIYGFVMAIVAGFLLTAVANWTGGAPVRQIQLMILCVLWLSGRIVMNVEGLPAWLAYGTELLFIPALAISLSLPLLRSWNTRNFIFLGLLAILWGCDIFFLLGQDRMPLYAALMVILVMISLIGGRIIPSFTVGALRRLGYEVRVQDQYNLDKLALLSLAASIVSLIFAGVNSPVFGLSCAVSAMIHALRMCGYHSFLALKDPLVWILHAGYGWLVIGLAMLSLSCFQIVSVQVALHALTVGCIGSLTLGMMCRVTLGHTGRNLLSNPVTTFSFILMQAAAVLRVAGPLLLPGYYTVFVVISGMLWSVCFLLYILLYAPMLWQARPDRQPA